MTRPIILGVVGDSGAGKTTITQGLVDILGEDQVIAVATDDYHRYDRKQRAEIGITPLAPRLQLRGHHLPASRAVCARRADPEAGLPACGRHLRAARVREPCALHRRRGAARLSHRDHARLLRRAGLPRAPEELRRKWKVAARLLGPGYTTDQVLSELDKREPDSAQFIRPQERYADMVVSFMEGVGGDDALDAELLLRDSLPQPDLSPVGRRRARDHDRRDRLGAPGSRGRRHRAGAGFPDRGGDLGEAPLRLSTCAPSGWASSRWATTCAAPSRWLSCSS